jgi:mannose-1-phosphate guanylyltransferase/mannose-6-phosphate isomerase
LRLWPMSRSSQPKQLIALETDRSMLQETILRATSITGHAGLMVVCNAKHRFLVAHQLSEIGVSAQIILEPEQRNTAASIAIAAIVLAEQDPHGVLAVLPSDHKIKDVARFAADVSYATTVARDGHIVTFGIPPTRPDTGYGYIRPAGEIAGGPARSVGAFVEKPDHSSAMEMVENGEHLWNSGVFVASVNLILEELAAHEPDLLDACRNSVANGESDFGFFRVGETDFLKCQPTPFDRAVMERTSRAAVIRAGFDWDDLGTWEALWLSETADASGTVAIGNVVVHHTSQSYLRSEGPLLAALGVNNLAVIATKDAILVADRSRLSEIGIIVRKIQELGGTEHADHLTVYRPWGTYQTVDVGPSFQVKHVTVNPGASISLQYHRQRAEHWVVVQGTAHVVRGDENIVLHENESTFIPIGKVHCLENRGDTPLRVIEVQVGAYLGEDDIVRLQDKYGRGS